jgi:hypothetical protein
LVRVRESVRGEASARREKTAISFLWTRSSSVPLVTLTVEGALSTWKLQ